MRGKREKAEDIVMKLRQVEVLQGQGKSVSDAVRHIGVTIQTYYRWRREYGRMNRGQAKRLKELEVVIPATQSGQLDVAIDIVKAVDRAHGQAFG